MKNSNLQNLNVERDQNTQRLKMIDDGVDYSHAVVTLAAVDFAIDEFAASNKSLSDRIVSLENQIKSLRNQGEK